MLLLGFCRQVRRQKALAALLLALPAGLNAQNTSTAADGYDPNVNGIVFSIAVQPDGKSIVAGQFTTLTPNGAPAPVTRNSIARVNIDGTVDSAFDPNVVGQINVVVLQPDGKIVIGGSFSSVGGVARAGLARLNVDGTLDTAFNQTVTYTLPVSVNAVALQADGAIVIGGNFTGVRDGAGVVTARNRIARIKADGTLDTAFTPSPNGLVQSIAVQADGRIVIGGLFKTVQGTGAASATTRNHLARLNSDGTLDTGFDPSADATVTVITLQPDGGILVGGYFSTFQPNGAATTTFRRRLARLKADGTVDPTFINTNVGTTPGGSGGPMTINAIVLQPDGAVVVGGYFQSIDDAFASYCARLKSDGHVDLTFDTGVNYVVNAIGLQQDGRIILGGNFTQAKPNGSLVASVRNHLVRVAPNGVTDTSFVPNAGGRISQIVIQPDGKALIGGDFTSLGGVARRNLARVNPDNTVDTSFSPNIDGPVSAIAVQSDGKILVGGLFQNVGGAAHRNIVRLNADGSVDATFDANTVNANPLGGEVKTIAVASDGRIYIGGNFTRVYKAGTNPEDQLGGFLVARLQPDGAVDLDFEPAVSGEVYVIKTLSDGNVLIGGAFAGLQVGDVPFPIPIINFARSNANGIIDYRFAIAPGFVGGGGAGGGSINAIEVLDDGSIILGGSFSSITVTNVDTGAQATTLRGSIVKLSSTGAIDTAYNPNVNGTVFRMVRQADGKLVVGGAFSEVRPNGAASSTSVRHLARFNPDGSLDTSFHLNPSAAVTALALQSDGRLLAGGSFISFLPPGATAPTSRNRIARINTDGTIDPTYDPNFANVPGAAVNALALQADGAALVGGTFSDLSGATLNNLARFRADGLPDASFTPNVNGPVYSIAVRPGLASNRTALRGFSFLTASGLPQPAFQPASSTDLRGTVHTAVRQPDGSILLGGLLTITGSDVGPNLVRFRANGTLDTAFKVSVSGAVNRIALQPDGKILIGGSFSTVNNTARNAIARLNADGTLDTAFDPNPNTNSSTNALQVLPDGKIMVGGDFVSMNPNGATTGSPAHQLVRLNSDGTVDLTIDANTDGIIYSFAVQPDGKIVIAGSFGALQPLRTGAVFIRDNLARLNADGTLDETFGDIGTDQQIRTVALQSDGKIIIGGDFRGVNQVERPFLARINADGTLDTGFDPQPNGFISSIQVRSDGRILIAGGFSGVGGLARNRIAQLLPSGALDPDYDPNFNGSVRDIALLSDNSLLVSGEFSEIRPEGLIYVGGSFSSISGAAVSNLARLNSTGTADGFFRPNPNGPVNAIVVLPDQRLIVAGSFTTISGASRSRIAWFNADGTLNTAITTGADGDIRTLALQPDGRLLVGGTFTSIGGVARNRIARLTTAGAVDTTFDPNANDAVNSIVVQTDGSILAGGAFTSIGGAARGRIAQLSSSGTATGFFNLNANAPVHALALHTDGRVLIGGTFTGIGGVARNYAARTNALGTIDTTFDPAPDGAVNAFAIQTDGKEFIGGAFARIAGVVRYRFARLSNNVYSPQSLHLHPDHSTLVWARGGAGPEISWASFELSTDNETWTYLGQAEFRPVTIPESPIPGGWLLATSSLPDTAFLIRARGAAPSGQFASAGIVEYIHKFFPVPVFTSATTATGTAGSAFVYATAATGSPTRYSATGLPPGLSINATTGVISGTPTVAGSYTVTISATNAAGTRSRTLAITINPPSGSLPNPVGDTHLINTSTRAYVSSGNPLFVGFVVSGTEPKTVVVRGVGPTLATLGVSGVLAAPALSIHNAQGELVVEAGAWDSSAAMSSAFASVGAFPLLSGSADAAVLATLAPGAYTAQIRSGSTAAQGVALAEVYALGAADASGSHLANLSARGPSAGSGNPLIAGLVIHGTAAKRYLVRGIGPALASLGVADALTDSIVSVYDGNGRLVAQNDDWATPAAGGSTASEIALAAGSVGAFPLGTGARDAAVIVTLQPGPYTVQVAGAGGAMGSGLAEIYELP